MKHNYNYLITKFNEIKEMGYIKSTNNYSNNSGETLERLLGSTGGDFNIPDFYGIEIKSVRNKKNVVITLFSSTPNGKYAEATKWLSEKYGYPDKDYRNIKGPEEESKLYNEKLLKINSEQIQSYFNNEGKSDDDIDFKKIIFEENYENVSKKLDIGSSYIYFTTPNLCDIDDFKFQFQCQESNSQIIGYILNNKMDEIINKMNCLPIINKIVNNIYNDKNLMITKMSSKNEKANLDKELIDKFNVLIPDIKNYFNVDFPKINNDTTIFELTNTKDNNIYNIYKNMNETIETYNTLLKNYKKLEEINIGIKDIQDFSDSERNIIDSKRKLKIKEDSCCCILCCAVISATTCIRPFTPCVAC